MHGDGTLARGGCWRLQKTRRAWELFVGVAREGERWILPGPVHGNGLLGLSAKHANVHGEEMNIGLLCWWASVGATVVGPAEVGSD